MEMLNSFGILRKVAGNLQSIIEFFHVFKTRYNSGYNVIFVTNEDKVFGMGKNENGVLGLGHQNEVKEVNIIPELCNKSVEDFNNSENFVLCLTSHNRLYSWGKNDHGQIGIGEISYNEISKPVLIEYFNDKNIVQICCGHQFSSVLTSDGRVHLWGKYKHNHNNDNCFVTPIENELNEEIKSIHCSRNQTFCVTINGNVYYCENINNNSLYCICLDTISNIQAICSSYEYTYFISPESIIYVFDEEITARTQPKIILRNLNFLKNFQAISVYGLNCVIHNNNNVYELIEGECNETKYKNLFDYYSNRHEITYKTIKLKVKQEDTSIIAKKISIDQKINNSIVILKPFTIANTISTLNWVIKYFHIFYDMKGYMLFVTNEEKVYGFGSNQYGCCGLGHDKSVSEPQIISELCHRFIISFFNGVEFAMALTEDNELFVWGKIKEQNNLYSKPTLLELECKINYICCSFNHALILANKGTVYGWGENGHAQLENAKEKFISTPLKLDKLRNIKLITCHLNISVAVSDDNQIFVWGKNILQNYFPKNDRKELFKNNIINIGVNHSLDENNKYLCVLTSKRQLFYRDIISDNAEFNQVEFSHHIKWIYSFDFNNFMHEQFDNQPELLVVTEDGVYFMDKFRNLEKSEYKSVFDFYANKFQITYKTIDFKLQNEIQRRNLPIQGNILILKKSG